MKLLKFIVIDEKLEIDDLLKIFEDGDHIQIAFKSLEDFNKYFNKFSSLLYDYAPQITSLYAPVLGNIFEDTVAIMSKLEDVLEISINHIVIEAQFNEDVKQLIDFYYDDLQDGSLSISLFETTHMIETVINIERNRYQGVNLASHMCYFHNYAVLDDIHPYTGVVYYEEDSELQYPYMKYSKLEGYFIKTKIKEY